jgi:hypothetical protein
MPQVKHFANGYGWEKKPFTAFILVENESAGYRRFLYDPDMVASRLVDPYVPVFFITSEEGQAMTELHQKPKPPGWKLTELQRHLIGNILRKVPTPDVNAWILIENDSLANLISF